MSVIFFDSLSNVEYAFVTIKARFPNSASKTRALNCQSTGKVYST